MKKLVIGILAHVDAGKTTLSEGLLYMTGSIRKLGRVDHKDAFFDTFSLERARGITIFSKQAALSYQDMEITLIDTPGHVDFSAEMERTLQVLDYAILVISGTAGVQGHTETLWGLLKRHHIPTFLFVNKMDLEGLGRAVLMDELRKRLDDACIDFGMNQEEDAFLESLAVCDEKVLEKFLEHGKISAEDIVKMITHRRVFPCFFGSALKLEGVEELLEGLMLYALSPTYPTEFGAKIYKITRDEQGSRLTHMKVTGGSMKVKSLLSNRQRTGSESNSLDETNIWEEKIDQIRIYSGTRYEAVDEVKAGTICAVTGLTRAYPGIGLGIESASDMPLLEPVLTYKVVLPPMSDLHGTLAKLRQLEEEDPQLHLVWNEQLKEIHMQLMGEVQLEVITTLIKERFDLSVEFGTGSIVYKETIAEPVEGVGHFEPLRHYAEVHLLLEPGEVGSGLQFETAVSEDELDKNWQNQVLTHLEEKEHLGVATGSPITDMKITLIAGRAHLKHTEGGDFREATYRAVRHGLKCARSILLEPYYEFRLELPIETVGRAMSDIQKMSGSFGPPETEGETAILSGAAPVATMRGYGVEITAYTRGRGRLVCTLEGYRPCHNAEEVIESIGYDSEADLGNPTSSVFCTHGAGFLVSWYQVRDYMHVDSGLKLKGQEATTMNLYNTVNEMEKETLDNTGNKENKESKTNKEMIAPKKTTSVSDSRQNDKELEDIYTRTYGPIKRKTIGSSQSLGYVKPENEQQNRTKNVQSESRDTRYDIAVKEKRDEYLLVDGYNIIFSWDELKLLARDNLDAARSKLQDILCNYQGFKQCIVIVVFDAYKVKGNPGETLEYHNIHVVFTKEAETADTYIERVTHELGRKYTVIVATSDALEQIIVMGQGAIRLSANDLKEEIDRINNEIRQDYLDRPRMGRNYPFNKLPDIKNSEPLN